MKLTNDERLLLIASLEAGLDDPDSRHNSTEAEIKLATELINKLKGDTMTINIEHDESIYLSSGDIKITITRNEQEVIIDTFDDMYSLKSTTTCRENDYKN